MMLRQRWLLSALVITGLGLAEAAKAQADAGPVADDLDQASELIVMIEGEVGIGAGIMFGHEDGHVYIATANHVVRSGAREAGDLRVMLRALPGEWLEAALMEHADPQLDLAVLSIEGLADRGITFCALPLDRLDDSDAARRGVTVYPVGYPNAVRWGTPVAPDRIAQVVGSEIGFQSTFVAPGHSGGGLITEPGKLIGMVVGDSPPFARATAIETVLERLREWRYPVQLHAAVEFVTTPLHEAVDDNDPGEVRQLLEACAFINTYSANGMMPLHLAAWWGRPALARLLLDAGADVNARTSEPPETVDIRLQTPLHLAAGSGAAEVVELLLDDGAEVDAVAEDHFERPWGGTPLHRAAASGSEEVVALLLAHGADPEAPSIDGTALAVAAEHGRVAAMKTLIAHGANLHPSLEVPLYLAADRGFVEAVEVLLEAGANPDLGETAFGPPLLRAARGGHLEIVDLLLEAGATVDATRGSDVTSLHEAVWGGHLDVVKRLLEAGADRTARDSRRRTPESYAESPEMKALFDTIGAGNAVSHGWLGVEIRAVDSEVVKDLGLQRTFGVVIVTTTPGGPADSAGLRPDDVITTYDGQGLQSVADLVSLVRSTPVGTTVDLWVERSGEVLRPQVRIGKRPD